ncbi:Pheromone alpha factor receptor [Pseudocercospora fuligena]|uniref:Pheromone alpha factor receptor n=1 Tax=Pseudocercospora fuligena TaxID=685502 RepID=A0A8H6R751_9PEZI|nr:Pheromone alpha factor receptor [Pseudocercospora fuligena]
MADEIPDSAWDLAPGFDPYEQNFGVTMPDGQTQVDLVMRSIITFQNTTVIMGIIYGIQIGVSILLLTILAVMTRPEKRRSVIFFLNLAALVLIFVRSVITCTALQGPFYNVYNWSLGYYEHVGEAIRVSIACEVMNFLVIVAIELSLLFQVRIVCCTLKTSLRLLVTAVTTLVAVVVCGIRFATMIVNAKIGISQVDTKGPAERALVSTMASATNISVICSIIFFSAIFCAKLGHAIYQRRTMGMKQFGPMQIIFVMGCQTLFIPGKYHNSLDLVHRLTLLAVIFGLLTYFVVQFSQIYSLMPMVVATFLPLSSMWASTNTKSDNIAAPHQVKRNRDVVVSPHTKAGGSSGNYTSDKELLGDSTLVGDGDSPTKASHVGSDRDSIDFEIQKMGGYGQKIHVDRTYTVRSD